MAGSSRSSGVSDVERPELDDTKDCISPTPDVFSYFIFTAPSERRKHRGFTVDALMSYVVVFTTIFIQATLLWCVYDKVIEENTNWRDGIVNTGQDWNLFDKKHAGCNSGMSLCSLENGTYTCAPPSVQLLGRWDELDTDGDDIWTRDEVTKAKEVLQCNYGVNAVEVFDVLILLLKEREQYIWLHPDVKNGKAIPKNYFTYIKGDVIMCGYRNSDMCGNLVQRGVFDEPLKNGNVPRIGSTIMSALDYCQSLLEPRGLCERVLPSTYATWKIESVQECQAPKYYKYAHKAPGEDTTKSMLIVDYKARQRYYTAQTPFFITYKFCIILIWILLIVSQVREVFKTMTFVLQISPRTLKEVDADNAKIDVAAEEKRKKAEDIDDDMEKAAHSMSWRHYSALFLVTCIRIVMHSVLLYVGLQFLGKQTDYISLLLDGVALLFIVEVESILYERGLRQDVRTEWEENDPILIKKLGVKALMSRPDVTDMFWFFFVVCMSAGFLLHFTRAVVAPIYDALQCTCLSEGDACREAHTFSISFWDHYWSNDVPESIQSIKEFKAEHLKESLLQSTPLANLKPALNLLKYHSQTHLGFGG